MSERIAGRCACGAISYTNTAKPEFTLICHCRQCQRISGSGHAAQFAVTAANTVIEGDVRYYDQTADSGNTVSSGFCATCGNSMLKKTSKRPELLFFHAATLDDPAAFEPQVVVFEDVKPLWDYVNPALKRV